MQVNPEDGPPEIYVTWSDPRMTDFENAELPEHSLPENPVVRRPRPVKSVADLWKVDNEKSCGLVIFRALKIPLSLY